MPKRAKELSAVDVRRLTHSVSKEKNKPYNALHPVGGVPGLLLQITPTGARSWIYRTLVGKKRQSIGLGPYPAVGLADARAEAVRLREQIKGGIDIVAARKAARRALIESQQTAMTFDQAAAAWIKMKSEVWTPRQTRLVTAAIKNHASPIIGDMPVADVGLVHIRQVLEPIWMTIPSTASEMQGRLENIMGWAAVHGYRDPAAQNPAQWSGYLDQVFPPVGKVMKVTGKGGSNLGSVHYEEITHFIRLLRDRDGVAARALEFVILTAARSSEVIGDSRSDVNNPGMTWGEVDLDARLWTIPKARMKMDRDHVVPLCDRAVEILKARPQGKPTDRIFPGPRGSIASDGFMRSVIRRIRQTELEKGRDLFRDRETGKPATAHGFRSSFKTWASDCTAFEPNAVERALSHVEGNKVVAAYDRGNMLDKRRLLMEAWADFCATGKTETDNNVVTLRREA